MLIHPPVRPHKGFLIAIEGADGTGKTTLAKSLIELLGELSIDAQFEREPTYGQFGQRLRDAAKTELLPVEKELYLLLADRDEHVRQVINPALKAGKVVIVDRYTLSTVCYQGCRGLDPEYIKARCKHVPVPDQTIILDLDPTEAERRLTGRGAKDAYEGMELQTSVRAAFQNHAGSFGEAVIVDAAATPDEVLRIACFVIDEALSRNFVRHSGRSLYVHYQARAKLAKLAHFLAPGVKAAQLRPDLIRLTDDAGAVATMQADAESWRIT